MAASWLGWENVFQVEIDPFCTQILARHFPNTTRYKDIKEFNGLPYRDTIDIISGGFPCQPWSSAGNHKGTEDPRHLWPQMLRVIREVRPTYVLGENVLGIVSKYLDQVLADLEGEGYEVWSFVIPALAVGAPHFRDRVWVVAHAHSHRRREDDITTMGRQDQTRKQTWPDSGSPLHVWDQPAPPRTDFCGVHDGIPTRVHRNKALGNAIVPQVAFYLFRGIEQYHQGRRRGD